MTGQRGSSQTSLYRLSILLDGQVRQIVDMPGEPLTIGRAADCKLVLDDPEVGPAHCRLYHQHGRLWFEDLGSAAGTLLNGQSQSRSALGSGDRLDVGPFTLVVEHLSARSASQDRLPGRVVVPSRPPAPPADGAGGQELSILLSLLETLDVQLPREDLLKRILPALLQALDGERVFLYRPSPRKKTVECIVSHRAAGADPALPVSETLVLKVARDRQPCVVTDLIGMEESGQESLVRLAQSHIQSVAIVPLEQGSRLVGVLYLDSRASRRSFTPADLDLLAHTVRYLAGTVDGIEQREELSQENRRLREIVGGRGAHEVPLGRLCAETSPFARVLELAGKGATSDVNVLLLGETGTGKEETARLVHRLSARRTGPFIAINCGAIPDTLVESELFGYRKGAFSGAADDRPGLVELSDRGTLFLDEVGELPPAAQVKLLRVLEERQVQRLGASEAVPVDFRLIAATHRELSGQVSAGTFRQDLLYRLNVFPVVLPPLRERLVDMPLLVEYLIGVLAPRLGRRVRSPSSDLLPALLAYEWPGNIRELRNVIERALVLEESEELTAASLPVEMVRAARSQASSAAQAAPQPPEDSSVRIRPFAEEFRDFERDYIRRLNQVVGKNISAMSRVSGLTRLTLYRKLGQIGLDEP